jgi:hypothetical protein
MAANDTKGRRKHAEASHVARLTRNTLLTVMAGVLVGVAIWFGFFARQQAALEGAQKQLADATSQVRDVQADIEAVRAGSSSSLRGLYDRVRLLESLVPSEYDALLTATWFESTRPQVTDFQADPAGEGAKQGNLARHNFQVTLVGPLSVLADWLATVQQVSDRFVTVTGVSLVGPNDDGNHTLVVQLAIWASEAKPLVGSTGQQIPVQAPVPVPMPEATPSPGGGQIVPSEQLPTENAPSFDPETAGQDPLEDVPGETFSPDLDTD